MDAHELVVAIKDLTAELGRVPVRAEFESKVKGANYALRRMGGYSTLLQAAGLPTYSDRRSEPGKKQKITADELFGRDILETVSHHTPKERVTDSTGNFEPILVIGDAHFPFVHTPTLDRIYDFAKEMKPKHIVQMGDLFDLYAHSRFPRSLNIYSPDQEIDLARKGAEAMWSRLQSECPDAKCYLITGNHDLRPLKKVLMAAPELETIVKRGIEPYFQFTGVTTISDYREILKIQGVGFHHGFMTQSGGHLLQLQENIVTAHTHKGSVTYRPIQGRIIWELNAGFIGDETSKVMGYTPTKTTGWTLGWGFIDKFGPRFVPA